MVIVNIINSILQAMVDDPDCELKSWQYNDLGTANVRLDNKKPSPTAVFLQVSDWSLTHNAVNVRETADVNISFLEKEGKLDAGGLEQDEIIDRMKSIAINFLQRLGNVKKLQIVNPDDDIKIKSVYLRSDSNRSGVNLQMTIRERQGECIEGEYNPVLTITENGTYTVAGYTQVVINVECPECPDCNNYLCFTANTGGTTITLSNDGSRYGHFPTVYYSTDKVNWTLWTSRQIRYNPITLQNPGDKVYLYGDNPDGFNSGVFRFRNFEINGSCSVSGDVTTLITKNGTDTIPNSCCFYQLFGGCSGMTTAPEIPATNLTEECYRGMFSGCTSLTSAPALPATTLASFCYFAMFYGCTSLTTAPELPATTLEHSCYNSMFEGCTSLEQAPALPATTLTQYCYDFMFENCTSLTQAPKLPATTLVLGCYQYMFHGCTSLTEAPELPATTLAGQCYFRMFAGCTSLTTAPALPATTLQGSCYADMFAGCTSLTSAPELPATTLASGCYVGMLAGCTSLNYIKVGATSWDTSYSGNWLYNVAPTGTFHKLSTLTNIPIDNASGVPIGWTVVNDDDPPVPPTPPTPTEPDYVSFTAEQAGATIGMVNTNNSPVLYWSTDKENWTQWDYSNITMANAGDKIYFYGNNQNGVNGAINSSSFAITGNVAVSGDITTLITREGTNTVPAYCFNALFQNCDITSAPELPATTLGDGCYLSMFKGCTSLTTAPALPATTLATNCYWGMFNGCASLTTAPALPATTLADGCYYGMFVLCSSLATAPELPATTLVQNCYGSMFNGCPSLQNVTCLATDVSATDCTWEWLNGVSETGTFTKSADMSSWPTGTSGIPSGWTVNNR